MNAVEYGRPRMGLQRQVAEALEEDLGARRDAGHVVVVRVVGVGRARAPSQDRDPDQEGREHRHHEHAHDQVASRLHQGASPVSRAK